MTVSIVEEIKDDINEELTHAQIKKTVNKGFLIKNNQFKVKDGKSTLSLDLIKSKNLHALNYFSKYKLQPMTAIKLDHVDLGEISVKSFLS